MKTILVGIGFDSGRKSDTVILNAALNAVLQALQEEVFDPIHFKRKKITLKSIEARLKKEKLKIYSLGVLILSSQKIENLPKNTTEICKKLKIDKKKIGIKINKLSHRKGRCVDCFAFISLKKI